MTIERNPHSSAAIDAQAQATFPPGLAGDIARFNFAHAPYPNATVAIAGALALMAALCGRFANVSGTGLNIWIGIVGGTGIGKEAAQSGIAKLTGIASQQVPCINEFIGPSSWASPEAIHKRLAGTPCVLGFIGELGMKIKIWCSPKASLIFASLVAFMLDVYGKSGDGNVLQARENSNKDNGALAVQSPALSLLGDTTPSELYGALGEREIQNGFLPRWILAFAGDQRGPANKDRLLLPPEALLASIQNLAAAALAHQRPGTVTDVGLSPEAQAIDDEIEAFTSAQINNTHAEVTRQLWSRARLNVLKVAALLAVGDWSDGSFTITGAHITWARQFVFAGILKVLAEFESGATGEMDGNQSVQEKRLIEVIKLFVEKPWGDVRCYNVREEMHAKRVIPMHYITKRLQTTAAFKNDKLGATTAIQRTIKLMLESDVLREMPTKQMLELFGSKPRAFVVSNPEVILGRSSDWLGKFY
ncbi:MAG TPA: hypothetical protein VGB79_10060 [Allosphingosinicella sp.]|jgi:hypothetical protein